MVEDDGGPHRMTGTAQFPPSWSLNFSYRTNSEKDETGRQNAVRPCPGSGRIDYPVVNAAEKTRQEDRMPSILVFDSYLSGKFRKSPDRMIEGLPC